jgi:hypothetical protein
MRRVCAAASLAVVAVVFVAVLLEPLSLAWSELRGDSTKLFITVAFISNAAVVVVVSALQGRATRAALRSYPSRRTVAFSSVSETTAGRLLRDAKVKMVRGGALRKPRISISPFLWGSLSETAGTAPALAHLQSELSRLGVPFRVGGYELLDFHTRQSVYRFVSGDEVYVGGVDAVIVPYSVMPVSAPSEARVVVELKKAKAAQSLGDAFLGQSVAELLAANGLSSHPCLLLLTDGAMCDVLRLEGDTVLRWADVELAVGLGYVADYLCTQCTPSISFSPGEVPCDTASLASTRSRLAEMVDAAKPGVLAACVEQLDGLLAAEQLPSTGWTQEERRRVVEIATEVGRHWRPALEAAGELPQEVQRMFL